MELHQLRYFLAVADEGNFTKAAEKCFVSQPSLSGQIIKLEDELGRRLFNRLGRRSELTAAGRFLEKRARSILLEIENAQRELQEGEEEAEGELKIGVTPSVGPYLLPRLVPECRNRYPLLTVIVEENLRKGLVQSLAQGDLEVVIASHPGPVSNISAEPFLQENLYLVAPSDHRLAKKDNISIRDFKDEPLIVLGESTTLGDKVYEFFGNNDFEPNVVAVCSQVVTVKALVHSGMGLAILPEMAMDNISQYDVVFKSLISARMQRILFVLTHERRFLSASARAFISTLKEFVDSHRRIS